MLRHFFCFPRIDLETRVLCFSYQVSQHTLIAFSRPRLDVWPEIRAPLWPPHSLEQKASLQERSQLTSCRGFGFCIYCLCDHPVFFPFSCPDTETTCRRGSDASLRFLSCGFQSVGSCGSILLPIAGTKGLVLERAAEERRSKQALPARAGEKALPKQKCSVPRFASTPGQQGTSRGPYNTKAGLV
jgi:hypothetical protein